MVIEGNVIPAIQGEANTETAYAPETFIIENEFTHGKRTKEVRYECLSDGTLQEHWIHSETVCDAGYEQYTDCEPEPNKYSRTIKNAEGYSMKITLRAETGVHGIDSNGFSVSYADNVPLPATFSDLVIPFRILIENTTEWQGYPSDMYVWFRPYFDGSVSLRRCDWFCEYQGWYRETAYKNDFLSRYFKDSTQEVWSVNNGYLVYNDFFSPNSPDGKPWPYDWTFVIEGSIGRDKNWTISTTFSFTPTSDWVTITSQSANVVQG